MKSIRGFAALPETDGPYVVYMDFRPGKIGLYIELKS